jgi:hypothetical protein
MLIFIKTQELTVVITSEYYKTNTALASGAKLNIGEITTVRNSFKVIQNY